MRRTTLLLLDNFEQLLSAATLVSELLRKTIALKIVVTSRAALRISREQEFPVPPLGLPDPNRTAAVANVAAAESINLFVERARAALPTFRIEPIKRRMSGTDRAPSGWIAARHRLGSGHGQASSTARDAARLEH